jgi:hypothetical protein
MSKAIDCIWYHNLAVIDLYVRYLLCILTSPNLLFIFCWIKSIPSIIGWIKSNNTVKTLREYHNRINLLYDDGRLDEDDIDELDRLKTAIVYAYSKGKINDQQYGNLNTEISLLYKEIYNKKIDLLDDPEHKNNNNARLLEDIKKEVEDVYSKGKMSELHYNLLNEKISANKYDRKSSST